MLNNHLVLLCGPRITTVPGKLDIQLLQINVMNDELIFNKNQTQVRARFLLVRRGVRSSKDPSKRYLHAILLLLPWLINTRRARVDQRAVQPPFNAGMVSVSCGALVLCLRVGCSRITS